MIANVIIASDDEQINLAINRTSEAMADAITKAADRVAENAFKSASKEQESASEEQKVLVKNKTF